MPAGFEVIDADLRALDAEDSVLFFRELLWADAAETGVTQSAAHVPTRINVPDGGLDATIDDADPSRDDVIPEGDSGFQVKSSDMSYSAWKDDVEEDSGLRPRIERLLDNDGTYVLVIFEELVSMSSDRAGMNKLERWKEEIESEFAEYGFDDADVRVYDSTRLAGFVDRFPALIAELKDLGPATDYSSWSRMERIADLEFVADEERDAAIADIRSQLRTSQDTCPVIRLTGLPGVGKTRLAYEALVPNDLKNRVLHLYADEFQCSGLASQLQVDKEWSAILVVDECSSESHDELVRRFGGQSDRLALITISDERDGVEADLRIDLGPLDDEQVLEILSDANPDVDEGRLERVSRFAHGFPRLAYLLSENVTPDPLSTEDNLLDFDDELLLRRLILNGDTDDVVFREHKRVLEVFSLFEKVAWRTEDGGLHPEAGWVAQMAGYTRDDEMARFREIVEMQRDRDILQGEYYLKVLPLPLTTYLLQSWWRSHDIEDLLEEIPPEMIPRFGERIPFMAAFDIGRDSIAWLLSPNGPFLQNGDAILNTEIGSQLFFKLAEALPAEAVDTLNQIIAPKSKEELKEFKAGRRQVVHALEYIAVWEDTFDPAARLLLQLGEAENEEWANNASGIFAGLFTPAYGKVAPTEASPHDRLPILEGAVTSERKRRQELGLQAAQTGLEPPNRWMKTVGPEYQGARSTPNLWMPDTLDDIYDYYKAVWELVMEELQNLAPELRDEGVEVLTGSVRGLAKLDPDLSEIVRNGLEELSQEDWIDNRPIIRSAVSITTYDEDALEPDEREAWEDFVDRLSEESYEKRLQRYVGLSQVADHEVYEEKLEELAEEGTDRPEKLKSELSWFVTSEPNQGRVYEFGVEVGERDPETALLDDIVQEFKRADNRSVRFLSGYLAALPDSEDAVRQEVLDDVQASPELQPFLMNLIRLSGMKTADAQRVIEGLKTGAIEPSHLQGLNLGGVSREIDEPVFYELCEYLLYDYDDTGWVPSSVTGTFRSLRNTVRRVLPFLEQETAGVYDSSTDPALVLLPIFHSYYVYPDEGPDLPKEFTIDLLTDPVFVSQQDAFRSFSGLSYDWKEIARALMDQYPDARGDILEFILEHFGNRGTLIGTRTEIRELLHELLQEHPEEVWDHFTSIFEQRDRETVALSRWLSGDLVDDYTPITAVDPEPIWEWVDQDPETRAPIIAAAVPPQLFHSDDQVCLAREVLKRYGDQEEVRDTLSANYGTDSWVGDASDHYEQKKAKLEAFKEEEYNSTVLRWVNNEIEILDQNIARAERFEESIRF